MSTATRLLALPQRIPLGPRALRLATLASVAALVVSVSLSLFGDLALRENERSARRTLELIDEALGSHGVAAPASLAEVVEGDPLLEQRLRDRRWLAQGGLLLHHGYLFGLGPEGSEVRAWPWDWGRTGRAAFALESGLLRVHPNPSGRWSGAGRAPSAAEGTGWRLRGAEPFSTSATRGS